MVVKSQHVPKIFLEVLEASKMGAYEGVDDLVKHIVNTSETALRRSNPKLGEFSDEVCLRLIRYVVRKLPSNRP
jgi:hypothetical protein